MNLYTPLCLALDILLKRGFPSQVAEGVWGALSANARPLQDARLHTHPLKTVWYIFYYCIRAYKPLYLNRIFGTFHDQLVEAPLSCVGQFIEIRLHLAGSGGGVGGAERERESVEGRSVRGRGYTPV